MTNSTQTDLVILGGGLAGLSLAIQVKQQRPEIAVAVLEKSCHPPPVAAHKVGESTVELAAHYFGQVLGLDAYLNEAQLPKLGLRCFIRSNIGSEDLADRVEVGSNRYLPTPGFQLDRGLFEQFLGEHACHMGIQFIDQARVNQVTLDSTSQHTILFNRGDKTHLLRTRWVVDATGRSSLLKRRLNLIAPVRHRASAVWFRIDGQLNIDDWSTRPQWLDGHTDARHSRWFSTNHLMGTGYWVWIIPLSSNTTSIGIVTDERYHPVRTYHTFDLALDWLWRHEPACAVQVAAHRDEVMDFRVIKNYPRNATQVFSDERWCLTGESGIFIDPLYAPGSDFIAISNTFISDLICRDFDGEAIAKRARLYDRLYRSYTDNTFGVFEGQYPMFGNATVMPIKIVWDCAVYWTFMAFVFCQGRLCDVSSVVQSRVAFGRIAKLNAIVQRLLREWHESESWQPPPKVVDLASLEFLVKLNADLTVPLDHDAYIQRMTENVERLKQIAAEIATLATQRHAHITTDTLEACGESDHLTPLFSTLGLT